jgi:hypothetical protein
MLELIEERKVKTAPANLLELEPRTFREGFNRQPFLIRHHLADHPLFSLPRLIELSRCLPADCVRSNAGNLPVNTQLYGGPSTGLSVEEMLRRIEECNAWLVLKFVEQDAEYGKLLNGCLDEIQALSDPVDPGMYSRAGFIFVSSPLSVTPYHLDPEYNFLLQVRGAKTVNMFDVEDRSIMSDQDLESYFTNTAKYNLSFKDEYQPKARVFELKPGLGLHFPVTAPHWVKNGDEVSVSFSITFRTPRADQRERIYDFNGRLRRMGLKPTPYGQSAGRDAAKLYAARALGLARRLTRRSNSD